MNRSYLASLALSGLLLVGSGVEAQTVVIEGARVFDGERDRGVTAIVIRDGRVASFDAASAPSEAKRVDYRGKFIIPGLVSNHSHVGHTNGTEHGDRFYTRDNVVRNLQQFQAYGVTTVFALGMNGAAFYDIRNEVAANPALGAQLFGAGPGIGAANGAPPAKPMNLQNDPVPRPSTADEARRVVREQVQRKVDVIKLWVDDLGGSAPQMSPEIYRAVIDEAHRHNVKVAAHIHDLGPAADLVASGVDIIAHGVRDQPVSDTLVQAMKRAGTAYIPTVNIDEANYLYAENPEWLEQPFLRNALQPALRKQFSDPAWRSKQLAGPSIPKARADVAMNLRNLRTLHEAGIRIGFGTDSGAMPHRVIGFAEHRELELMTQAGFTPQQALTVATRDAAALANLVDRGMLVAGKRADFVVLDANPLADIRNSRTIVAVWQLGREVSGRVEARSVE